MNSRTGRRAATAAAMVASAGAVLLLGVSSDAVAVPPDVSTTYTSPQAQAALETGVAALKDAEVRELNFAASGKSQMPPALVDTYTRARTAFEEATQADPALAEAWNGLGYSQRKLGDYDAALASYAKALELKPGYPQATEYRGEAYLALNRVEDAKQAYLELFAGQRELADQLLGAMKKWIAAQQSGANEAGAADLAKWVEERSKIAAQTAALTREGTTAGWR